MNLQIGSLQTLHWSAIVQVHWSIWWLHDPDLRVLNWHSCDHDPTQVFLPPAVIMA